MLPRSFLILGGAEKIVGFWGSWSPYNERNTFKCSDIDPQLFTHLVYTYIGITETFDIDFKLHYQMIQEFVALKIQNKNLKLIASVGGCLDKTTKLLSHIAAKADSRENFATNAVNFLKECGLDGLDINWNFPTEDDKNNFVLLLKALRQAFNVPKYILTSTPFCFPAII